MQVLTKRIFFSSFTAVAHHTRTGARRDNHRGSLVSAWTAVCAPVMPIVRSLAGTFSTYKCHPHFPPKQGNQPRVPCSFFGTRKVYASLLVALSIYTDVIPVACEQLVRNKGWNQLLNVCTIIHLILPMVEIPRCLPCLGVQKLPASLDPASLREGHPSFSLCVHYCCFPACTVSPSFGLPLFPLFLSLIRLPVNTAGSTSIVFIRAGPR